MAWSRTLTQLIADVRSRADMETSNGEDDFATDAVITTWINLALSELVEFIVAETDELWGIPGLPISVSPNATTSNLVDTYALQSDVFKPVGVEMSNDGGTTWITIDRFPFVERNQFYSSYNRALRYAFVGNKIMFRPVPKGGITFRYWYIPSLTQLANGTDAFDFVNGWDDWVACRVAIRCLQKEESDTSALERDLGFIRQRIMDGCRVRDQGGPTRVADTRGLLPRPFDDGDFW